MIPRCTVLLMSLGLESTNSQENNNKILFNKTNSLNFVMSPDNAQVQLYDAISGDGVWGQSLPIRNFDFVLLCDKKLKTLVFQIIGSSHIYVLHYIVCFTTCNQLNKIYTNHLCPYQPNKILLQNPAPQNKNPKTFFKFFKF